MKETNSQEEEENVNKDKKTRTRYDNRERKDREKNDREKNERKTAVEEIEANLMEKLTKWMESKLKNFQEQDQNFFHQE